MENLYSNAVFELQLIGAAVILGLVQMLLGSSMARMQQGLDWGMGSRDEPRPVTGVAGRLQRAFTNYCETFPLFAAAMFAAILLGKVSALTYWGGLVYLIGRVLYVPLYASGVYLLRTVIWCIATLGIFAILAAMFV